MYLPLVHPNIAECEGYWGTPDGGRGPGGGPQLTPPAQPAALDELKKGQEVESASPLRGPRREGMGAGAIRAAAGEGAARGGA